MTTTPPPVWALLSATIDTKVRPLAGTLNLVYSSKINGQDAVSVNANTISVGSQVAKGTPVIVSLLDSNDGWRQTHSLFSLQFVGIKIAQKSKPPQPVNLLEKFPFYLITPTTGFITAGVDNGAFPVAINLPDWLTEARTTVTAYPWALTWMYLNDLDADVDGKKYAYSISFMFADGSTPEVFTWDPTEEADH